MIKLTEWMSAIGTVALAVSAVFGCCAGLYLLGVPAHLYLLFIIGMLIGILAATYYYSNFPFALPTWKLFQPNPFIPDEYEEYEENYQR